ncbi:hypothetical protein GCM10027344_02620 [Spelaeicoccus albus]
MATLGRLHAEGLSSTRNEIGGEFAGALCGASQVGCDGTVGERFATVAFGKPQRLGTTTELSSARSAIHETGIDEGVEFAIYGALRNTGECGDFADAQGSGAGDRELNRE